MTPSIFRPGALGLAAAFVLALAAPAHANEVLGLDLADPANGTPGGVAAQSQPLASGVGYTVTISGTGSLWSTTDAWSSMCGEPEPGAITQPSAGKPETPPTVDAAVIFAAPTGVSFLGGEACSGPDPTSPPVAGKLLMGTAGAGMTPATPIGGQPAHAAPSHFYAYAVTGDGTPLQLRYDDEVIYDNSGILTVTVWTDAECALAGCTTPGAVLPTPSPAPTPTPAPTALPTPEATPTPTPAPVGSTAPGGSGGATGGTGQATTPGTGAGAPQKMLPERTGTQVQTPLLDQAALMTARHGDACVNTNVLSVRLVTKKRTRLKKVIFWIDKKRVRTVKGKKLYVSLKTKHRRVRVQKFRKLPKTKFVFRAKVQTSGGKTYKLRQVYYRCTPPRKAAKSLPVK